MKSFNLFSLPWSKSLIIITVILCSMAFKNPSAKKQDASNLPARMIGITDTVPKTDININIDLSKILADVDVALAKIDFDKIAKDVRLSLEKIDFSKIQKDIDISLKNIDWEKMNKEIRKSLEKIDNKKIKIEIDKSMRDAKKQMNSKEFKQSMEKLKEVNMIELKEELRKAKIETEKGIEELKKELEKMKADANAKDAASIINFGIERNCLILI
ncbi:MAG: hypothetical protein ABJA90_00330 [Ginsengibacter sp.]